MGMVAFTAINLIADFGIIVACWKCGGGALLGEGDNMNFYGALAHLAADIVRGIAVLICGILAVVGVADPLKTDAYCSLFVCLFVLSATASLLRVLAQKVVPTAYEYVDEGEGQGDGKHGNCSVEKELPLSAHSP